MTKFAERKWVTKLRRQGKSYSEIRRIVHVSKSSLSLWLRDVALTEAQIRGLKKKKLAAIERYKQSMRVKREKRLQDYYDDQVRKWIPLSRREEFISGLFLYWGEGNKVSSSSINISNTDPAVIKFAYYWMKNCLNIPEDKISIMLHLYSDMNIQEEIDYWSKEIRVKKSQFKKPYIKESLRSGVDQKGFGHGTCGIWAFKTTIKENILMAIKAISDSYGRKDVRPLV